MSTYKTGLVSPSEEAVQSSATTDDHDSPQQVQETGQACDKVRGPGYQSSLKGLNPHVGLPRHNLPLNISYRPMADSDLRLLKHERPPFDWYDKHSLYSTDYSDARQWFATDRVQKEAVWQALQPTIKEYEQLTGQKVEHRYLWCLDMGYDASYDEMMRRLESWAFEHLGANHAWTKFGKITKKLFKLDRWPGMITDYRLAPNWPVIETIPDKRVGRGR